MWWNDAERRWIMYTQYHCSICFAASIVKALQFDLMLLFSRSPNESLLHVFINRMVFLTNWIFLGIQNILKVLQELFIKITRHKAELGTCLPLVELKGSDRCSPGHKQPLNYT